MKEFYYQIKGKCDPNDPYSFGKWAFPPIFSGKVSAIDRKSAKLIIDEEYGKVFPLRVLSKDIDSNEYLLAITEITENSGHARLFTPRKCMICESEFRIIDKYNDHNCFNKGSEYCSDECKKEASMLSTVKWNEDNVMNGKHIPVIYKITNKKTGLSYIGKTTQAFTFRWYQHFFQLGDTKFHREIKETEISDWTFEVIEVVKIPETINNYSEADKYIFERERSWINHHDSVKNGYNSI
jgi:hypothetical protein